VEQENNTNQVQWVLDENLAYNTSNEWLEINPAILDIGDEGINRGTPDYNISSTLDKKHPGGYFIFTANKRKDNKGDYFHLSNKSAIVKFSKDINTTLDRKKHAKKFKKMIRNEKKILGSIICITKEGVWITKNKKTKIVKYDKYI